MGILWNREQLLHWVSMISVEFRWFLLKFCCDFVDGVEIMLSFGCCIWGFIIVFVFNHDLPVLGFCWLSVGSLLGFGCVCWVSVEFPWFLLSFCWVSGVQTQHRFNISTKPQQKSPKLNRKGITETQQIQRRFNRVVTWQSLLHQPYLLGGT